MSWTEEHVEALRGYLGEVGVSFKEATASLNKQFGTGYSRNSVISKCGREKIISKNGVHVHGMVKEAKPRPDRRRRDRRPPIMAETAPLRSAEVEPRNLTLLELGPGDCRWPVSGDGPPFLFCGNPIFSVNYCGAHHFLSRRNRE